MVVENPCVVMIIADESQRQWLYALLSRYYRVLTALPADGDIQHAGLYLFDEIALVDHQAWLSVWRQSVQPDSPSVLLLSDSPQEPLPAEFTPLVDEVLPVEIDAEHLREHINQWLQLRESVLIWQRASNSHQNLDQPLVHPAPGLNCPLPQTPLNQSASHSELPSDIEAKLMSLLFETSSQGMFVCDMEGSLITVNPAFASIVGYSREELLGHSHRLVKSHWHPQAFYDELWQTISSGHNWHGEVCNRRKNGELYWVEASILPVLDAQGLPVQYLSIRTDNTHLKAVEQALQEKEARYRSLVDTVADGIVLYDPNGRVIECNPAAEQILGLRREQILGHSALSPIWRCVYPDGRPCRGDAHPVMHTLATGRREIVANFKGSNSAPAWSPDGRRLAVVLTKDGQSQLYVLNADGSGVQRLASSAGIDTEPAWSPDGMI